MGKIQFVTIYDPKKREIQVAPLRDRIAYHALMNVCEPVFERYQIDQSCACRKGKGQSRALRLAAAYSRKYDWYLKLDIRKYFDSVSHEILKSSLFRLFKDQRLLELLSALIDSYESAPGRGIPIGSLTSQFFANHYLGMMDHFVKEELRCRGYVRYMDDFVLWEDRKETLAADLTKIEEFAADRLRLTLKAPCLNRCARGLPFLGYKVYPGRLRLLSRSRLRFMRRYRKAVSLLNRGVWDETEFARHAEPLSAFVTQAESRSFRRRLMEEGAEPQRLEPGQPGRKLEQQRRELPVCEPEQERPGEPEQQPGVPSRLSSPVHGDEPSNRYSACPRKRGKSDEASLGR